VNEYVREAWLSLKFLSQNGVCYKKNCSDRLIEYCHCARPYNIQLPMNALGFSSIAEWHLISTDIFDDDTEESTSIMKFKVLPNTNDRIQTREQTKQLAHQILGKTEQYEIIAKKMLKYVRWRKHDFLSDHL